MIIWIIAAFSSMIVLITASSIDAADHDDAVVLQQRRAMRAERAGDARPHLLVADQVDGVGIDAEFLVEQRRRLAEAAHRPAGRRQRHRIGRMGVNDAVHVGARLEDLRVDEDLAVAARAAGDDLAFEIDGEDVLRA